MARARCGKKVLVGKPKGRRTRRRRRPVDNIVACCKIVKRLTVILPGEYSQ
jgi:hypothetical protein